MAAIENTPTDEGDITKTEQSVDRYDKKCIFCKIVNGEMGTELLHNVSMPSFCFNCDREANFTTWADSYMKYEKICEARLKYNNAIMIIISNLCLALKTQ